MIANAPIVGQWYISHSANCPENYRFSVVEIDAEGGYIELKDEDGFIADIGTDVWPHIGAERILLGDVTAAK